MDRVSSKNYLIKFFYCDLLRVQSYQSFIHFTSEKYFFCKIRRIIKPLRHIEYTCTLNTTSVRRI